MATPPRVFISYSPEDKDMTTRVAIDLRADGLQVWIDAERDMTSMQSVGMAQCDWFVLILTPHSSQAPLVQREMTAAVDMARQGRFQQVFLLLAAPMNTKELPPTWQQSGSLIDATRDYPGVLKRLAQTIRTRQKRLERASSASTAFWTKFFWCLPLYGTAGLMGTVVLSLFQNGVMDPFPLANWPIGLIAGLSMGLLVVLLPGRGSLYVTQILFPTAFFGSAGGVVAIINHWPETNGLLIGALLGFLLLGLPGLGSVRRW